MWNLRSKKNSDSSIRCCWGSMHLKVFFWNGFLPLRLLFFWKGRLTNLTIYPRLLFEVCIARMLCIQSFIRFLFSCHLHLGVPHWLAVSCLFVSIELQLQEINPAIRNGVYSHLEAFVPCNKDTLIKRLKKLHLNVQVTGGRVAQCDSNM